MRNSIINDFLIKPEERAEVIDSLTRCSRLVRDVVSGTELRSDLSLDAKMLDISISLLQPSIILDEDMAPLEGFESFLTCFQNSCELEYEKAVARFSR